MRGEHRRSRGRSHLDPSGLPVIGEEGARGRELAVEHSLLGWEQRHQHVVRRLSDRRGGGVAWIGHRRRSEVGLVAALNRVDGVVHGALDHREVEIRDGWALFGDADIAICALVFHSTTASAGVGLLDKSTEGSLAWGTLRPAPRWSNSTIRYALGSK